MITSRHYYTSEVANNLALLLMAHISQNVTPHHLTQDRGCLNYYCISEATHKSQNLTPHHLTQDCVYLHYCFQCTSQNQPHRKIKELFKKMASSCHYHGMIKIKLFHESKLCQHFSQHAHIFPKYRSLLETLDARRAT